MCLPSLVGPSLMSGIGAGPILRVNLIRSKIMHWKQWSHLEVKILYSRADLFEVGKDKTH